MLFKTCRLNLIYMYIKMYVIKLNKTEQLYKISTVNVQTNKNELLWYMFMWPPVYIKYTHVSLSYCLGVFQVYNRWCVCVCVCMEEGCWNPCPYVRLDIIQWNLRLKKTVVIQEIFVRFLVWKVTCMYMYHLKFMVCFMNGTVHSLHGTVWYVSEVARFRICISSMNIFLSL